jgi:hypothetical protein
LSETKVTDSGLKLAAAPKAGAGAGAGAAVDASAGADSTADPAATAPPVASPAAIMPAATSPALTTLDIDRDDTFALMTTRIRRKYDSIADPGWPALPIGLRTRPPVAVWSNRPRKTRASRARRAS